MMSDAQDILAADAIVYAVSRQRQGQHRALRLMLKRVIDIAGAIVGLMALLPLLALIGLLIKLSSPGPVLFRQQREGFNGRPFVILKFRTMHVDASAGCITWLGRILRSTSIDELPQLLNVLRGEMSLVGPRPHIAGMTAGGMAYEQLVPRYHARLAMKPGMTGLAQCQGYRGSTDDADAAITRVELDLRYIETFSIRQDMAIIVRTLWSQSLTGNAT